MELLGTEGALDYLVSAATLTEPLFLGVEVADMITLLMHANVAAIAKENLVLLGELSFFAAGAESFVFFPIVIVLGIVIQKALRFL